MGAAHGLAASSNLRQQQLDSEEAQKKLENIYHFAITNPTLCYDGIDYHESEKRKHTKTLI